MHSDQDERHLSPDDLAEREGVPVTTIYQWNRLGDRPPLHADRPPRPLPAGRCCPAWEDSRYAGQEAVQ